MMFNDSLQLITPLSNVQPYLDLEKEEFIYRQRKIGQILDTYAITHMIDIGAYYNPINLFMSSTTCPKTFIVVEPILDPLSALVPCAKDPSSYTHYIFLPITFKYYIRVKDSLPLPETVVCIGCDGHYGPSRRMLETTFARPYTLFIEYPAEYYHNKAFNRMNGDGLGEKMAFKEEFKANTNETQYTKRMIKVIEYN